MQFLDGQLKEQVEAKVTPLSNIFDYHYMDSPPRVEEPPTPFREDVPTITSFEQSLYRKVQLSDQLESST